MTVADEQKDLPNAYWLTKMHKAPVGCDFIVASKQFSTKPLTKTTSNVFERIYSLVESFHNKSQFYSNFRHFQHNNISSQFFSTCRFLFIYTTIRGACIGYAPAVQPHPIVPLSC